MGRALPDPNEIGIALAIAVGYLSGSIPSGYWIVAAFKHTDIRKHGSGSIGTSNVWRTYGRWYGVPVVLLDATKGFVPAFVFAVANNGRDRFGGSRHFARRRDFFARLRITRTVFRTEFSLREG